MSRAFKVGLLAEGDVNLCSLNHRCPDPFSSQRWQIVVSSQQPAAGTAQHPSRLPRCCAIRALFWLGGGISHQNGWGCSGNIITVKAYKWAVWVRLVWTWAFLHMWQVEVTFIRATQRSCNRYKIQFARYCPSRQQVTVYCPWRLDSQAI